MDFATKMLATPINKIRDILRSVGVTDTSSLDHCVVFIVLRSLKTKFCKTIGIPEKFAFDRFEFDDTGEKLDIEQLRNKFNGNEDCFCYHMVYKFNFSSFTPSATISNREFRAIFDVLKTIDTETLTQTHDIIGTIYELHLKTGSKSSRDLGQFFTNRLVIKYMIELTDPKLGETIVDPTMGTGGFLTMSVQYLIEHNEKISWKRHIGNIHGYDINDHVQELACLNMLLETGCKPETLIQRDTLKEDMVQDPDSDMQYDVILANEPMGVDCVFDTFCDKIRELKMKGNNAEPAFMQLFMQRLAPNGRCAVIVPDGFLFNNSKQHKATRKHLIENFAVHRIIQMRDKNFFVNTNVSASIIFFSATGKTTQIELGEISLNPTGNVLAKKTGRIIDYSEIVEQGYNLNPQLYEEKKETRIKGIVYKKLGEVCKFLPTTRTVSALGRKTGMYRFYNSSQEDRLYLDTYEVDCPSLIIGNGGNLCVHYDVKFTPSKHVTVAQLINTAYDSSGINPSDDVDLKYVYYFLLTELPALRALSQGTTIKWLNRTNLSKVEIPIPSLDIQRQLIRELDIIHETTIALRAVIDNCTRSSAVVLTETWNCMERKKLGEVCKFKNGKNLASKNFIDGAYPVIGGGKQPAGYHNTYNTDSRTILCSSSGAYSGYISRYETKVWISDCFAIIPNSLVDNNFLFYYLKSVQEHLYSYQKATAQPHVYSKDLADLEIPIPTLETQIAIVRRMDAITDTVEHMKREIDAWNETGRALMRNALSCKGNETKDESSDNESIEVVLTE